tara:strand:+ start:1273 stop:1701 length:429 start_codon:yes stop_codon:yes gene_type:complete
MAYINSAETKAIRKALKERFPEYKFSVKIGAGNLSVSVSVVEGPAFDKEEAQWNHVEDKFVAPNLNKDHSSINEYYIEDHYPNNAEFFKEVVDIIKTAPFKAGVGDLWFDKSDIMTDYAHISYYINLHVGAWNKPFQIKEAA